MYETLLRKRPRATQYVVVVFNSNGTRPVPMTAPKTETIHPRSGDRGRGRWILISQRCNGCIPQ
jgi:hypothetical protein